MGFHPDDNKGCTCETPTGSENRMCSYCRSQRRKTSDAFEKKRKRKKRK